MMISFSSDFTCDGWLEAGPAAALYILWRGNSHVLHGEFTQLSLADAGWCRPMMEPVPGRSPNYSDASRPGVAHVSCEQPVSDAWTQ